MEIWLKLEHKKESSKAFIESIEKISLLAETSKQHQILLEAMLFKIDESHLKFCTEVALKAVRMDRHRLDSARTYTKNEKETDAAAASLSCTCKTIAKIYASHWQMKLVSDIIIITLIIYNYHYRRVVWVLSI